LNPKKLTASISYHRGHYNGTECSFVRRKETLPAPHGHESVVKEVGHTNEFVK
jgi:hypothetical protein